MGGREREVWKRVGRPALTLALVLAAPVLAREPAPAAQGASSGTTAAPSFLASFMARFRFAGGLREDAARLAAIDTCVEEMSFIIRPFARSRLRSATRISREIAFEVNEAVLAIEEQGDRRKEVKLAGPPVPWRSASGDALHLTLRRDGEHLVLRSATEDGAEERVLSLSPDGQRLTIDVTILAGRLPLPVRYRLSYQRVPPLRAAPPSTPAAR